MSVNKRRYLGILGTVFWAGLFMAPDAKALPDEFRSACAATPQFEDTFARRDLGPDWKLVAPRRIEWKYSGFGGMIPG